MRLPAMIRSLTAVVAAAAAMMAGAAAHAQSGSLEPLYNRLNSLEQQVLTLTNRVEQLDYQVRELNSRVDLLARDVDFRFSELGSPGSGSAPTAAGGGAAPPPRLSTPALDGAPQGAAATTAPTLPSGTGTPSTGTAEAEFQAIRTMLDSRDYASADTALRAFIAAHPAHPLASSAFFWLGEIYYDRVDYQRAAETYAAGYANYPSGYKAADTLLKLGLSLLALNRPVDACATLNQLRAGFPSAPINIQQRADAARASAGCS